MSNQLINVDFSVENYKNDLQEFYKKVKSLFEELKNLNEKKETILKIVEPFKINNETQLKMNKQAIDTINNFFKPLEIINNEIKKLLNNFKSNFAGQKGLDHIVDNFKKELIQPLKNEQLKYDAFIKETKTLKEQAEIKTTIGIRTYKVVVLDEIITLDVPMKY